MYFEEDWDAIYGPIPKLSRRARLRAWFLRRRIVMRVRRKVWAIRAYIRFITHGEEMLEDLYWDLHHEILIQCEEMQAEILREVDSISWWQEHESYTPGL